MAGCALKPDRSPPTPADSWQPFGYPRSVPSRRRTRMRFPITEDLILSISIQSQQGEWVSYLIPVSRQGWGSDTYAYYCSGQCVRLYARPDTCVAVTVAVTNSLVPRDVSVSICGRLLDSAYRASQNRVTDSTVQAARKTPLGTVNSVGMAGSPTEGDEKHAQANTAARPMVPETLRALGSRTGQRRDRNPPRWFVWPGAVSRASQRPKMQPSHDRAPPGRGVVMV